VILAKYFGLADPTYWRNRKNNTQMELQPCDILFAFDHGKQSFLGINYCLLVVRKEKIPSVLIPTSRF